MKGMDGKQRLREQKEFARAQGFDLPSAAPVAAAPTGAAPTAAAPASGAAPELVAQTQGRINNLMRFAATASPQMANNALAQARILQDQLELYSKPGPAPAAPARLQDRFVPVGKLVFDRQEQQFITPPAAAIAATPSRAAAAPAPKEPAAKPPTAAQAAKSERMAEARQALSRDIETQLGYYERLANMGGMVSPSRSPVANVTAFARSSGLGQKAEQALGTEAQTLRDNIKNTRQRLFMQIKDATGATSGQMNSNMEMQAWLDSMTNPQQSIETVRETLKQMDSVIAGVQAQVERERAGKGAPERPAAAPVAAPAPAAPAKRREIAPGVFVTERP